MIKDHILSFHLLRRRFAPTNVNSGNKQPTPCTVGVQTDYRESEAQTDPYRPEYMLQLGTTPSELLQLVTLTWGMWSIIHTFWGNTALSQTADPCLIISSPSSLQITFTPSLSPQAMVCLQVWKKWKWYSLHVLNELGRPPFLLWMASGSCIKGNRWWRSG